jgi:predicted porin
LSSKQFGTFNIGRQLTGIHGVLTATSPIAANNIAGDITYSDDQTATNNTDPSLRQHRGTHGVEAVRASNSISYITPAFSGLTARVDYAADKANSDSTTLNKD